MPNTLAHAGVQTLLSRSVFRNSDLIWIYIGLLIPDFPWILQRMIKAFFPGADLYDVALYCTIQGSLIFSLIMAAALAGVSSNFKKTFTILSVNVLLHLILDSLETKWGNGIQLFVPFNWSIINFGFFWPESIPINLITLIGLIYILFKLKDALNPEILFDFKKKKILYSLIILIIYLIIPFFLIDKAEAADNHYIKTLRNTELHAGKYFEIDRGTYKKSAGQGIFITPFKKEYKVIGKDINRQGTMSIKAKFLSENEIIITDYHYHLSMLRDIPSYFGIFLIIVIAFLIFMKYIKKELRFDAFSGKEFPNSLN